jgi:hypothetical protein
LISANLRKHAHRIKAECGWMAGGVPDIYHDLLIAADHIDHMDKLCAAQNEIIAALKQGGRVPQM